MVAVQFVLRTSLRFAETTPASPSGDLAAAAAVAVHHPPTVLLTNPLGAVEVRTSSHHYLYLHLHLHLHHTAIQTLPEVAAAADAAADAAAVAADAFSQSAHSTCRTRVRAADG